MGLDYAFEMWVPKERLFDMISLLPRLCGNGDNNELTRLVWPDGRRLPAESDDLHDPIPFDGSLNDAFCLSFDFETDEALELYNETQMADSRRWDREVWDYRTSGNRFCVGCIWTYFELEISELDWLDGEEDLRRVRFVAATTTMSQLFEASPSIQSFFVTLARSVGAVSCVFDKEGSGDELLCLDGQLMRIDISEASHPRWLRHLVGGVTSNSEHKARNCQLWRRSSLSAHQQLELQLLTRDADSGVRAQALRVMTYRDSNAPELRFLQTAATETDWRLRALAAYLLGYNEDSGRIKILASLLTDDSIEVRIAAVESLSLTPALFEERVQIAFDTPPTPGNLGLILAALKGFGSVHTQVWRRAFLTADYPFSHLAFEKLK